MQINSTPINSSIHSLPVELLSHIYSFLPLEDQLQVIPKVSIAWYNASNDLSKAFRRQLATFLDGSVRILEISIRFRESYTDEELKDIIQMAKKHNLFPQLMQLKLTKIKSIYDDQSFSIFWNSDLTSIFMERYEGYDRNFPSLKKMNHYQTLFWIKYPLFFDTKIRFHTFFNSRLLSITEDNQNEINAGIIQGILNLQLKLYIKQLVRLNLADLRGVYSFEEIKSLKSYKFDEFGRIKPLYKISEKAFQTIDEQKEMSLSENEDIPEEKKKIKDFISLLRREVISNTIKELTSKLVRC